MTTMQVLCRYGDDPSVGQFWVTMDELANALSALQATTPDGPDDAPPPQHSTYKWRVDAIGGHHDNYTHGALYTCDAIPVSGDTHKRVLDALAAATQRTEAAEAKLAAMVKGNERAQAVQPGETTLVSKPAEQMRANMARAQQAERNLVLMTQRAEQAEAELRESERDLSDMAANSNRLHAIAEQMRQRAVAAEDCRRESMVYRVLLTGAMIRAGFENKATDYGKFSVEYFTGLFGVALNSGGFFDEGCEWPEIQRVAELLHVDLSDYEEAQP